jgi:hypothetical protein
MAVLRRQPLLTWNSGAHDERILEAPLPSLRWFVALVDASVPQIASFTGHSLKDVEEILDKHDLGRDVKLAEAAVMRLNENEERSKVVK